MLLHAETQANFKTFIVFWLSQTVSQLGSAMTGYALVLWVYGQTNSALSVSLLTLCSYAPYVLVSVFAGGFVDRHRKKSIMLCADTVAFLCTLLIAALLLLNQLSVPWIYLVNAITGFMNAFQSPASAVANGRLVPQDKLTKMSGLQSISGSAVSLASPMLAAFLMSTFGIASVLLADVGTFLFAAGVLLFFIRIPGDDAVNRVQKRGFEPPFAGLREGLAFLKQDAAVRTMILVFAAPNFFSRISYEKILSPMILSRSGSRQVLGLVSGILGFGGVIGGILAARLPQPKNLPRRIFLPGILSFLFGDLLMGVRGARRLSGRWPQWAAACPYRCWIPAGSICSIPMCPRRCRGASLPCATHCNSLQSRRGFFWAACWPIESLNRSWPGHRLRRRRLRSWLDRVRAAAWP